MLPSGHLAAAHASHAPSASTAWAAAVAAVSLTIPHALGLSLIAYAPLGDTSAIALWSWALPCVLMTIVARAPGVVYLPSTAMALLFGAMFQAVMQAGQGAAIEPRQGMAITGAVTACAFGLQWVIARSGVARLARFLPLAVTRGFIAGIGVSVVLAQFRLYFGAPPMAAAAVLAWHVGVGLASALLAMYLHKRWPKLPGAFVALVVGSVAVLLLAPEGVLRVATTAEGFQTPPVPDWSGAPWQAVVFGGAPQLASLAVLMAIVNSLEVMVFRQQWALDHPGGSAPERQMGRDALWGGLTAMAGLIPGTTNPLRTHLMADYTGVPSQRAAQLHAGLLVLVAFSSHLWLGWIPVACLTGILLVAGIRLIAPELLRRPSGGEGTSMWLQAWLVAGVFAAAGGILALVTGLLVAVVSLLRASADHAIRRVHLHGQLRSRIARRPDDSAWLGEPMRQVVVLELQGLVSFGVAATVIERVRAHVGTCRYVLIDAARVPAWDETAFMQLRSLAVELREQGIELTLSGLHGQHSRVLDDLRVFEDLDHSLEWVEEQCLAHRQTAPPEPTAGATPSDNLLGDLGKGMPTPARLALQGRLSQSQFGPHQQIFAAGADGRSLVVVHQGQVTLGIPADAQRHLRLAAIGPGMIFGEMGFLTGMPRTASAWAGPEGAVLHELGWDDFQAWSKEHPDAALAFMSDLARLEIRRLGATTTELRSALE